MSDFPKVKFPIGYTDAEKLREIRSAIESIERTKIRYLFLGWNITKETNFTFAFLNGDTEASAETVLEIIRKRIV